MANTIIVSSMAAACESAGCDCGGNGDSSLPPGYVSLAMLQERWMREQRRTSEKRHLREEKEEEGKKGTDSGFLNESLGRRVLKNEEDPKISGGSLRDHHPPGRVKNGGREMVFIEVEEKGKEIVIGGSETGDANNTAKKKWKKGKYRKKKSVKDGQTGDGERNVKINGVRLNEVEIVPRDDVKVGNEGVSSGKTNGSDQLCSILKGDQGTEVAPTGTVVLPRNFEGERQQIPNAKGRGYGGGFKGNKGGRGYGGGFKANKGGRGDFRRNGDNQGYGRRGGGNELKDSGANSALEKEESEKRCDEGQKEGDKISNERDDFHSVEDEVDALKVNEVKLYSENKAEDGISEVTNRLSGLNGRYGNGFRRYGNGNWRGSAGTKFRIRTISGGKVGYARSWEERNAGYNGRYANSRRADGVWVKKGEGLGDAAAKTASSGISGDRLPGS